jgi:methylated-DNA-[protein]-cysteine S-methyltransferase
MMYLNKYDSPLGMITMVSDGTALTGLWFEGQKYFMASCTQPAEIKDLPVFAEAKFWLDQYFSGQIPGCLPPLRPKGTSFQQTVWEILMNIPYGETVTYKEIAEKAALKTGKLRMSAQAAGNALGHNPISIMIPCHRVIGTDGSLKGYAGGIERKQYLLELEKKRGNYETADETDDGSDSCVSCGMRETAGRSERSRNKNG